MSLNILDIKKRVLSEKNWTLFLDRDGVVNQRIVGDYVKNVQEFNFIEGVPETISKLTSVFSRIVMVTNQQGIGKGIMTELDLKIVHDFMLSGIRKSGGNLDAIYFSPYLATENHTMRKPQIGMALKAKEDFPEIDFERCIMIGDSLSDMKFGKNAGMITVFTIPSDATEEIKICADFVVNGLHGFGEIF